MGVDQSDHCELWAAAEQCTRNAAYMRDMCALSCQMCNRTVVGSNSGSAQKNVRGGQAPDKSKGNEKEGSKGRNDLVREDLFRPEKQQERSSVDVPPGGLADPGAFGGSYGGVQAQGRKKSDRHTNQVNALQKTISVAAS